MVSHEQEVETMPWPRQALACQMPLRHMYGCPNMHVASSLIPARGRCPTSMHVSLDMVSMACSEI